MIMQGAHNAKYFVNSYLESDLPNRLVAYRNQWNLDDEELPEPLKYLIHEPIAIDHWPTLITAAISMNGLERTDYSFGFRPNFNVQYAMRTYIWVKDDNAELCTLKRDRLVTVLRSAFLDAPGLDRCAGENNLEVMIDESTIREEYSDLTLIKGERMMAGAYIAYTLTLNEVTGVPTLSDTSMYDVEAYNIGAQEDFEDL
jgi:hypothetical protein